MATYSSRFSLPCEWDRRAPGRHQQVIQQYLKVEGLTIKYVGPGQDDSQAAAVRADNPVPPDVPLYYFEITVVNSGAAGYIGVGFATDDVKPDRLPGWEPHSYGYHGDDGCAFHGSGQGREYGPKYTQGDVIGALLDRATATIRFFKNGQDLGVAFRNVTEQRLFPTVGLRTQQEEVRANFGANGSASFAVDLPGLRSAFVRAALDCVRTVQLPSAGGGGASGGGEGGSAAAAPRWPLLPGVVFEYLLHHRCWRTAEALAKDALGAAAAAAATAGGGGDDSTMGREGSLSSMDAVGPGAAASSGGAAASSDGARQPSASGGGGGGDAEMAPAPALEAAATAAGGGADGSAAAALSGAEVEDALRRQRIYDAVCGGRLDEALEQVETHYGAAALASSPGLAFRLRVQQFLELIRARAPPQAVLEFGRSQLGPAAASAEDEELLSDAVSLLAYADPEASPCGTLLSPAARASLGDRLNGALLAARGRPPAPTLERLYRQAVVVLEELRKGHEPRALVLDPAGVCMASK